MKLVDKVKDKIRRIKFKNEVDDYLYGLKNETTEPYETYPNFNTIKVSQMIGQRYAKILITLIKDYYNKDNYEAFCVLKQIINKYGKLVKSKRPHQGRGPGPFVTQLYLPEELQDKIDKLYNKYKQEQEDKFKNLLKDIDELAK